MMKIYDEDLINVGTVMNYDDKINVGTTLSLLVKQVYLNMT